MMSCRASGSVPFLLVAFVSLIAQSTTYVQELRIDIIPDDADSSQHDTDDEVWPPPPPPHPEPARHRRMPPSSIDKGAIIDILNRLRRSHGAPDMYYVNWDKELEKHAADLTTHCRLASIAQRPRNAKYARGVTGYTKGPGGAGVADELQKIYFQDSNSSVYWQVTIFTLPGIIYLARLLLLLS